MVRVHIHNSRRQSLSLTLSLSEVSISSYSSSLETLLVGRKYTVVPQSQYTIVLSTLEWFSFSSAERISRMSRQHVFFLCFLIVVRSTTSFSLFPKRMNNSNQNSSRSPNDAFFTQVISDVDDTLKVRYIYITKKMNYSTSNTREESLTRIHNVPSVVV